MVLRAASVALWRRLVARHRHAAPADGKEPAVSIPQRASCRLGSPEWMIRSCPKKRWYGRMALLSECQTRSRLFRTRRRPCDQAESTRTPAPKLSNAGREASEAENGHNSDVPTVVSARHGTRGRRVAAKHLLRVRSQRSSASRPWPLTTRVLNSPSQGNIILHHTCRDPFHRNR